MPRTKCQNCDWKGEIDEEFIGEVVVCPSCEKEFVAKKLVKKKMTTPANKVSSRTKAVEKNQETSSSSSKKLLKIILSIGGPIGAIALFFLSAYLWDEYLYSAGENLINTRQYSSAAEKSYTKWLTYTLHIKSRNKSEIKYGSKRMKAASGVFPSKDKYLQSMNLLIDQYLNNPDGLNEYAWELMKTNTNNKFALELSLKAKKLIFEEPLKYDTKAAVLDSLALAYYKNGNKKKALEEQKQAIKYLKQSSDQSQLPDFNKRLKLYQ